MSSASSTNQPAGLAKRRLARFPRVIMMSLKEFLHCTARNQPCVAATRRRKDVWKHAVFAARDDLVASYKRSDLPHEAHDIHAGRSDNRLCSLSRSMLGRKPTATLHMDRMQLHNMRVNTRLIGAAGNDDPVAHEIRHRFCVSPIRYQVSSSSG